MTLPRVHPVDWATSRVSKQFLIVVSCSSSSKSFFFPAKFLFATSQVMNPQQVCGEIMWNHVKSRQVSGPNLFLMRFSILLSMISCVLPQTAVPGWTSGWTSGQPLRPPVGQPYYQPSPAWRGHSRHVDGQRCPRRIFKALNRLMRRDFSRRENFTLWSSNIAMDNHHVQ